MSEVILKVFGFSEEKKGELIERAKRKYTVRAPIVINVLNSIERSFGGYWYVYGTLHNIKDPVRLKREENPQRFDESALMLLPDNPEDIELLIEHLIWMPVKCILLPEGVAGVPIRYREINEEAEIYSTPKKRFYLKPLDNRSTISLFQTRPVLS